MSQGLKTEADLSADELGLSPDIDDLVIEDDIPVDNLISEKQQRLLTEALYSNEGVLGDSREGSALQNRLFLAAANVGVFYAIKQPPLVPDIFVSLDVEVAQDWTQKKNRTYFVWEFGKPPDIVIELVSNREGNELGRKLQEYARMGVGYYAVFDPLHQLGSPDLYLFENRANRYQALTESWFEEIGLGLIVWDGVFEGKRGSCNDPPGNRWLRWHDATGAVIPTGAERATQERQRAEAESQRAEAAEARAAQLTDQLRSLGIDPNL
ncbi:Uma2 family endonuclease [Leptolyngbyaceae cyanobacterium UHCC 1019]